MNAAKKWNPDTLDHPNYVRGRLERIAAWARRWDEFTTDDVADAHRMTRDNASQALSRMARRGLVVRVAWGVYRVAR